MYSESAIVSAPDSEDGRHLCRCLTPLSLILVVLTSTRRFKAVQFVTTSKDAIQSATTNKNGFKKVVRLRWTDTFKAVWFVPSKPMVLKQSDN